MRSAFPLKAPAADLPTYDKSGESLKHRDYFFFLIVQALDVCLRHQALAGGFQAPFYSYSQMLIIVQ